MPKKKTENRRVAAPLAVAKLVFVCDTAGATGFWQHPVSGARTRTGGALSQRFAAQDKEKIRAALAEAEKAGSSGFVAALEGGTHSGTLVDIHVERMQMGPRRQLLGFMQTATPRTGLLQGAASTEEGLDLASQVLENIAEGILILDRDLNAISVNRAYLGITGQDEAALIGRVPHGLREEALPAAARKEILRAVATNGHWRGELQDQRHDGSSFTELASLSAVRDKRGQLSHYVAVITDMTQLHAYEDRLAFLASHDSLTGLPNRFMLMRRLAQAVQHSGAAKTPMALLYLDIDNFALVNSTFGTAVGDEVLRKLAHRLQETVTGWGEAFHLGSDGFGVLLPKIGARSEAVEMAQSILAGLEAPLPAAEQNLYLSASIGIATAPPDHDAQLLFRHAGHAMHAAMRRGAGSIECFSGGETDTSESLRLATGLRQAMEHGELFLHYQPYFDLYSGNISGAEALLRWQHPELGLIPPARFIPVAEETGHIVRLGEWVLKSACLQMRAWQDAGLQDLHMAVNISPRQLRQPDFLDRISKQWTDQVYGRLIVESTDAAYGALTLLGSR